MNNRVGYSWIAVGLMFLSGCHAKPETDGKCEPQEAVEAQPPAVRTINEQGGMMTLDEDFEVDLNRKGESHNPFHVSKL